METLERQIIAKLIDRLQESKTVLTAIETDIKDGTVGQVFVKNEISYIDKTLKDVAELKSRLDKEVQDGTAEEILTNYLDCEGFDIPEEAIDKIVKAMYDFARKSLRDKLIKFDSRYDKYQTTNIKNTEVPAFLERLKKDHEKAVDEYLKDN